MLKTLWNDDCHNFEKDANDLIKQGYELKSSFCGLYHFMDGGTAPTFMGIFEKKEEV